MLPKLYSNYYEPFPRDYSNAQPYQIVPNYDMEGRMPMPMQTKQPAHQQHGQQQPTQQQPTQQQPTQQQPMDFSSNFEQAPGSPTDLGMAYTQGYLRTQIGKRMRITFLIGTNQIQDRQGTLLAVGISYIIIKDIDTNTSTLCDIYSIKFVTIYP